MNNKQPIELETIDSVANTYLRSQYGETGFETVMKGIKMIVSA